MENADSFESFISTASSSLLANVTSTASNIASQLLPDISRSSLGTSNAVGSADDSWNPMGGVDSPNGTTHEMVDTDLLWKEVLYTQYNLDPQYDWKIPQYYSLPYQIIGTLFQGIIFIVGVLGNVMVVIVVLRSRGMRTPTNCYLVSLAIADSMVLLASVPNGIIAYYLLGDKWIWGRVGCALFIFFQFLGINASSLSIAAFTVERYIAICHPMLAHKLCTVRRAKRIIMYVWMFAIAYCSPWLFLTKIERLYYIGIESEVVTCKFALNREHYKGYFLTDMVLFYILPLLVSCVLYALIARILYQNDILRRSGKGGPLSGATNVKLTSSTSGLMPPGLGVTDGNSCSVNLNSNSTSQSTGRYMTTYSKCQLKKNASSSDASRVQVVKMLAVVVAVFATLWLPYRALVVYNSFTFPPYMELWYLMFAKTMIFVNSAINPIIYSACSIKFRREFKRMLTCNRKPSYYYSRSHRTGGNGTTVSGATDIYFGETLRANRSGATLRSQSGAGNLQYCTTSSSVSNLAVNSTKNMTTLRRESAFLSPSHALVGYESRVNKNGSVLRTSASISKLASCTRSVSKSEGLSSCEDGDGAKSTSNGMVNSDAPSVTRQTTVSTQNGNASQATITSNTNINLSCSATIKTSITLIYNNDRATVDGIVKRDTNLVASEEGTGAVATTLNEKDHEEEQAAEGGGSNASSEQI